MNNVQLKISLLRDILVEKREVLIQILNICENQEYLINEKVSEDYTAEMLKEKQKLVDKILQFDNVFQATFDGIEGKYEAKDYRQQFVQIQALINEVLELDIKIRSQERKNKELQQITKPKKLTKLTQNYVAKRYQQNSKPNHI